MKLIDILEKIPLMIAEAIDMLTPPSSKVPVSYAGRLTTEMGAQKFFVSCVLMEGIFNCFKETVVWLQELVDGLAWDHGFRTCDSYNAVSEIFTNLYTGET